MPTIHPKARTTPAVRAEIARSSEPTGVLARRYGVSTETIRKWRKRGPDDCQDRSARPHTLPWKASEEERAIICALRRATGFPLDDLTFVVTNFLPHLNRDAVYRILKAEGLNRLPAQSRSRKPDGAFKEYGLGFVHLDVKHLPKLRDRDDITRKRFLFVAIDRCSRWVHLAIKDDETTASAVAFLKEAVQAFPFTLTHVLTDRGSCFTADGFEALCREVKVQHRTTRPYTPQTNGMVERFNGRVQREVLGITIHSHADLETLLKGFNRAYNARRQRVLGGLSPDQAVRQRMKANPKLASTHHEPPSDPCALPKALLVVAAAKEVSHPDNRREGETSCGVWRRVGLRGNCRPLGNEEGVSRDAQCGMVMEPAPAASLVVPEPDFLREFLVVALDPPAPFGEVNETVEGDVLSQGREPVFRWFILLGGPLNQQPFLRAGFAEMVVAMRQPHPRTGEA
jgi:transposase InsO family protein